MVQWGSIYLLSLDFARDQYDQCLGCDNLLVLFTHTHTYLHTRLSMSVVYRCLSVSLVVGWGLAEEPSKAPTRVSQSVSGGCQWDVCDRKSRRFAIASFGALR